MNTLKISENLFLRYEQTQQVKGYCGLLAAWALAETAVEAHDDKLLDKCRSYLALYPDHFDHPRYNFENYRVGGNGKAWLVAKGLFDEERENIRKYAEITMNSPRDSEGIICHPQDTHKTWIDVAFCITPFMLYAGLAFKEQKYIDFAVEQTFLMYDRFLDRTCGLLHQCKGFLPNPEQLSSDHWGRGNGWCYIALATLVEHLPKDSIHRPRAEKLFKDLSEALLACQTPRGVWRQQLDCEYAWDECSSTGLIAYGFGLGMRLGLLERKVYQEAFESALNAIVNRFIEKDFSTKMCCYGCLCPGYGETKGTLKAYLTEVYPTYNDPHSFGTLMFAMLEAYRNGITDLVGESWE